MKQLFPFFTKYVYLNFSHFYEYRCVTTRFSILLQAKVIGYVPGKGNNTGKTGALRCVMECGKEFSVGSG